MVKQIPEIMLHLSYNPRHRQGVLLKTKTAAAWTSLLVKFTLQAMCGGKNNLGIA